MKRLIENFPSLTGFSHPGEMNDPAPGGGGNVDMDDVIAVPSDHTDEPIEPNEVPDVDVLIMQRWYPDCVRESSDGLDGVAASLKGRVLGLLRNEGLKVTAATVEALDSFLSVASSEHRRQLGEEDPFSEFESFSNDTKGRG